jgi:L-rhamnose mutarotase
MDKKELKFKKYIMKPLTIIVFISLTFFHLAITAAGVYEFYVSPVGNDNNLGTFEQPFQTIDRAKEAVSTIKKTNNTDIYVFLRGGRYYVSETLHFGPGDSGMGQGRVIYSAYKDEQPVISGGVRLTGWEPYENGIWKAPSNGLNFRQLYVNNQRSTRARQPNKGDYNRLILWGMAEKEVFVHAGEIQKWQNFDKVEMVVQMAWAEAIMRLNAVKYTGEEKHSWIRPSYARISFQQPERDLVFARDYPPKHADQAYHFENAYEFIDQPGEWYLDQEAGWVYYLPLSGEDPSRSEIIAPTVETLLSIKGDLTNPAVNITFYGIGFEHSTWTRPSEQGHLVLQAGQFTIAPTMANTQFVGRPPAAVLVEAAKDIRFENNVFRLLGATGLDLHWGTSQCSITGNAFADIAGNGISVGIFSHPDMEMHIPYQPTDERILCRNDVISSNYIYRVGQDYPGSCGIAAGYPQNITIEHNEVAYLPYTGISLGWGWTHELNPMKENKVRYNHVHHVVQDLCDGGAVYTLSFQPGTQITGNYIHDINKSSWAGKIPIKGIYLDEGSGGSADQPLLIKGNLVNTGNDVTKFNFHRAGIVLYDFNTIRASDFDGEEVVKKAGPLPQYHNIRKRIDTLGNQQYDMKQIVFMAELKDEASATKKYRYYHGPEGVWPEVLHAAKESGLKSVKIYQHGNRLVMILELPEDLSLDEMNRRYAASSVRLKEWGEIMSALQQPPPGASPGETWVTMEMIHDYENNALH